MTKCFEGAAGAIDFYRARPSQAVWPAAPRRRHLCSHESRNEGYDRYLHEILERSNNGSKMVSLGPHAGLNFISAEDGIQDASRLWKRPMRAGNTDSHHAKHVSRVRRQAQDFVCVQSCIDLDNADVRRGNISNKIIYTASLPTDYRGGFSPLNSKCLFYKPASPLSIFSGLAHPTSRPTVNPFLVSTMANLDWESHKAEIERIYVREKKTLTELRSIMQSTWNFHARWEPSSLSTG